MKPLKNIQYLSPFVLLVVFSIFAFSASASEPNFYRYKNSQDITVIGLSIPPEFVGKGYDILNRQGRVLKHILPALTPEQIRAKNRQIEIRQKKQQSRKEQQKQDQELLRLYSQPDDAVRILTRKIQDIRDLITLKKSNISDHISQKDSLEKKAADRQRAGKKISSTLLNAIRLQDKLIKQLQSKIKSKKVEIKQTYQFFNKKITRLEYLTGKKASNYQHLLNK